MSLNMNPKNMSQKVYSANFIRHVHHFMQGHDLLNSQKRILLSISGGVDSICLLQLFIALEFDFEVLHFNHGTRGEANLEEENFIKNLCRSMNKKLHLRTFDFSLDASDFENRARGKRREVYHSFIESNYWVYTAHHLDDSFEWSLMQAFKQSSLQATLGIPVFAGGIVRPFMCVSKNQLLKFAKTQRLKWLEDESNNHQKFERNRLRIKVTSEIKKSYPQYLKHYVSRHNQMAYDFGVHQKQKNFKKIKSLPQNSSPIGSEIESSSLLPLKDEIKKAVFFFSDSKRGEIDFEISKILESHDQSQNQAGSFIKGPLSLSGGVNLFILKNTCFIYGKKELNLLLSFDQKVKNYLSQNLTQIPDLLVTNHFPHLVIDFNKKLRLSTKFIHPLMPETCLWLKDRAISYSYTPLLCPDDRQMLISNAVILDSSSMG